MAKAKPDLGDIRCPQSYCGKPSHVRRAEGRGLFYVHCRDCGPVFMRSAVGQDWIMDNATMYGPEGKPEATPAPAPAPEPVPAPVPIVTLPPRKRGASLDDFMFGGAAA